MKEKLLAKVGVLTTSMVEASGLRGDYGENKRERSRWDGSYCPKLGFFTASAVKVGGLHGSYESDGREGHMKGSY